MLKKRGQIGSNIFKYLLMAVVIGIISLFGINSNEAFFGYTKT